MNLKLASTLLLINAASARNLRAERHKRFLKKYDYTAWCVIMPKCNGKISAKDLKKAGEKAIDEVFDENVRHRRMKGDTFGFVVDDCKKNEIENEIEDGISQSSSEEDNVNEKTDLDVTCIQMPSSISRSVCAGVDTKKAAKKAADQAAKMKCHNKNRRGLKTKAAIIEMEDDYETRSGDCSEQDMVQDILKSLCPKEE